MFEPLIGQEFEFVFECECEQEDSIAAGETGFIFLLPQVVLQALLHDEVSIAAGEADFIFLSPPQAPQQAALAEEPAQVPQHEEDLLAEGHPLQLELEITPADVLAPVSQPTMAIVRPYARNSVISLFVIQHIFQFSFDFISHLFATYFTNRCLFFKSIN